MSDGKWCLHVEFTFDVKPGEVEHRHIGDAEVDFAARAFDRVRPLLNEVVQGLDAQTPGGSPSGWYVLHQMNQPGEANPRILMRRVKA
jgi:hypothetical protein